MHFEGVAGSKEEEQCFKRGGLSKSGKTVIASANVLEGLETILIRTWGYKSSHLEIEVIQPNHLFYFHVPGKGG